MRPALTDQALRRRGDAVDLNGKRILLTGASSGIGEAAAEKFARRGAAVVVVARRQELLDAARRADHARGRRGESPRSGSVGPRRRRRAGRQGRARPWRCGHPDQQRRQVDPPATRRVAGPLARRRTNDDAELLLTAEADPRHRPRHDRPRRRAHHQRVDLGRAERILAAVRVYNASKAALSAVSRVIETEWADKGVHSTTLYYPLVKTPMIEPTRAYDGPARAERRRSRRLDDHRGPHPSGAHRSSDGGHRTSR